MKKVLLMGSMMSDVYGKVTGTTKLENEVMSVEIKKIDLIILCG